MGRICMLIFTLVLSLANLLPNANAVQLVDGKRKRVSRHDCNGFVYGEALEKYPSEQNVAQTVELTRYITAYGTTLEAVVDVTPFSPLLQAAADTYGNITFYNHIDTWVSKASKKSTALYMNNVTGECSPVKVGDGQGWALTASLLFWPRSVAGPAAGLVRKPPANSAAEPPATAERVDTKPYASLTLATGSIGSAYGIGNLMRIGGNLTRKESEAFIVLEKEVDLSDSARTSVYSCPTGWDSSWNLALSLGLIARRTKEIFAQGNQAVEEYQKDMTESFIQRSMISLEVTSVVADGIVVAKYPADESKLPWVGADVYLSGVFTDQEMDDGTENRWWNMSLPFKSAGKVIFMNKSESMLHVQLNNRRCMPQNESMSLPGLVMVANASVISHATKLVHSAVEIGRLAAQQLRGSALVEYAEANSSNGKQGGLSGAVSQHVVAAASEILRTLDGPPLLLRPESPDAKVDPVLNVVSPMGRLDLDSHLSDFTDSDEDSEMDASAGKDADVKATDVHRAALLEGPRESVCVISQLRSGLVLKRPFEMKLRGGDRVVAQLSITGHGWSSTTEQCGEYCHAVYGLHFNGKSAANVTQFRDFCKDNPIGEGLQHGTWWESRNGWCPGSVQPGLFLDVTDFLQSGKNEAEIVLNVWSSVTGSYVPYTNHAGFAYDDTASLSIGFSLFSYSAAAVAAVRGQPEALTAAEAALRDGSSDPRQLRIPKQVAPTSLLAQHARLAGSSLMERVMRPSPRRLENATSKLVQKSPRRGSSMAEEEEATVRRKTTAGATAAGASGEWGGAFRNIEAGAPWYLWNSSARGEPFDHAGNDVVEIQLFKKRDVQASSRLVFKSFPELALPADWSRVALHLRVEKPEDLDVDHWDRQASIGLALPVPAEGSRAALQLNPADARPKFDSFGLVAASSASE
eukprot:TRINITY_DN4941_c0_g1_i4.p1 TRINITY_DN4941_c0_g1~~TRINITY_DN4941_c0_g1_i4.p1  ORF type:complete len:919 (+),score=169.75 TRINITY_DN4941_c0_g1_i4:48-2804(+)